VKNTGKKSPPKPLPSGNTNPAGLYDRHGPIPVADMNESNADSVWALFQDSTVPQKNGESILPADDLPFQKTVPAPLKP
jgi:hypothetical protein